MNALSRPPLAQRVSLMLLWGLSLLVALVSWRFFIAPIEQVMNFMLHHAQNRPFWLYLHIVPAPLALLLLPVQFSTRLRRTRPKLHRWLGRLYALSILLASVAGLVIAISSAAGPVAAMGFGVLAVLWLATTAVAVQRAMARRIADHRRWMIRSAALTLAAVTLRIYLPIGEMTIGFDTAYPLIAWACWVPNMIIAEWILSRQRRATPRAALSPSQA